MPAAQLLTWDGRTQSKRAWARELGIATPTLNLRLQTMPYAEVFRPGRHWKEVLLTHNGETHNLEAWAEKLGVHPTTLTRRRQQTTETQAILSPKRDWQRIRRTPHPRTPPPAPMFRTRAMRWCPHHERGWYPGGLDAPGWTPMPRGMLALALGYAGAYGCPGQIRITETACDLCAS